MNMDPQRAAAQAVDPATSAEQLAGLAVQHRELWPQLAAHPNAYDGLVDWMRQQGFDPGAAAPPQPVAPLSVAPQPVAPTANPLRPPEDDAPSPRIRMTDPGPTRPVPPLTSPELTDLVAPKEGGGQRELQLGPRADGGRFENAEPTLIDGEDIDLPAYLRKKRKR